MSENYREEMSAKYKNAMALFSEERAEHRKTRAKLSLAVEAIRALVIIDGREIGFRTPHNLPMEMAKSIERKVRAVLTAPSGIV